MHIDLTLAGRHKKTVSLKIGIVCFILKATTYGVKCSVTKSYLVAMESNGRKGDISCARALYSLHLFIFDW